VLDDTPVPGFLLWIRGEGVPTLPAGLQHSGDAPPEAIPALVVVPDPGHDDRSRQCCLPDAESQFDREILELGKGALARCLCVRSVRIIGEDGDDVITEWVRESSGSRRSSYASISTGFPAAAFTARQKPVVLLLPRFAVGHLIVLVPVPLVPDVSFLYPVWAYRARRSRKKIFLDNGSSGYILVITAR
jgi:hypothetical protein